MIKFVCTAKRRFSVVVCKRQIALVNVFLSRVYFIDNP